MDPPGEHVFLMEHGAVIQQCAVVGLRKASPNIIMGLGFSLLKLNILLLCLSSSLSSAMKPLSYVCHSHERLLFSHIIRYLFLTVCDLNR